MPSEIVLLKSCTGCTTSVLDVEDRTNCTRCKGSTKKRLTSWGSIRVATGTGPVTLPASSAAVQQTPRTTATSAPMGSQEVVSTTIRFLDPRLSDCSALRAPPWESASMSSCGRKASMDEGTEKVPGTRSSTCRLRV